MKLYIYSNLARTKLSIAEQDHHRERQKSEHTFRQ